MSVFCYGQPQFLLLDIFLYEKYTYQTINLSAFYSTESMTLEGTSENQQSFKQMLRVTGKPSEDADEYVDFQVS